MAAARGRGGLGTRLQTCMLAEFALCYSLVAPGPWSTGLAGAEAEPEAGLHAIRAWECCSSCPPRARSNSAQYCCISQIMFSEECRTLQEPLNTTLNCITRSWHCCGKPCHAAWCTLAVLTSTLGSFTAKARRALTACVSARCSSACIVSS